MKKYPFSARKHAHDIELVANRSFNLAHDAEVAGDYARAERYLEIHTKAEKLLLSIMDGMQGYSGITMLAGEDIGLAKEYVFLAGNIRDGLQMQYKG